MSETARGNGNTEVYQLWAKIGLNILIVVAIVAIFVFLFYSAWYSIIIGFIMVGMIIFQIHMSTSVLRVNKNHSGLVFHNDKCVTNTSNGVLTEGTWWFLDLFFGRKEVQQASRAQQLIDATKNFLTIDSVEVAVKRQIQWKIEPNNLLTAYRNLMDGVVDLKKVENWLIDKFDKAAISYFRTLLVEEVMPTKKDNDNLTIDKMQKDIYDLAIKRIKGSGITIISYTISDLDHADPLVAKAASAKKKAEFERNAAKAQGEAMVNKIDAFFTGKYKEADEAKQKEMRLEYQAHILATEGYAAARGIFGGMGGGNQSQGSDGKPTGKKPTARA